MENPVTQLLTIRFPIIQGGMGNISDPKLAASISNAGGLGTIGAGTMPVEDVIDKIKLMKAKTANPCCVNIPISVHPDVERLVQEVIRQQVPIVSLSAGNPSKFIPIFHDHGIKVICVTSTVHHAKKAEEAGADLIVCEGYEAAGINALNESTTMVLVPQMVKALSVPVVAAGGIADGKGLAAALALGACGVQMGTRFIATKEAPYHPLYKNAILDAKDEATVIVGRKYKRIRRLMKNQYAHQLLVMENSDVSLEDYLEQTNEDRHIKGAIDGNMAEGFINSGQIAGLIDDCPSVEGLILDMVSEAKEILSRSLNLL